MEFKKEIDNLKNNSLRHHSLPLIMDRTEREKNNKENWEVQWWYKTTRLKYIHGMALIQQQQNSHSSLGAYGIISIGRPYVVLQTSHNKVKMIEIIEYMFFDIV